jgi:tetraacyldisaccharide 4'-kinase
MRWLAPAGALYGRAGALRARLYAGGVLRRSRLDGPVISVGNLSVGGSGKTPLVVRCARILMDAGLPVSILSRGYGGAHAEGPLLVSDGSAVLSDASEAGDEPAMMARMLPGAVVAVGGRRDDVGRFVEARFGPRVHVLDDGFQHLRLVRDLDVVCVRPHDLEDRPLPAGRLRETPAALARADVVVAMDDDEGRVRGPFGSAAVFRAFRTVTGFADRRGKEALPPKAPFLLSGIARPERFETDAAAHVERVAGSARFRDHHAFTRAEVAAAFERARASGADAVVTTAKDAERLRDVPPVPPLLVLGITVRLDDEGAFAARLLAVARRAA